MRSKLKALRWEHRNGYIHLVDIDDCWQNEGDPDARAAFAGRLELTMTDLRAACLEDRDAGPPEQLQKCESCGNREALYSNVCIKCRDE